MNVIIAGLRAIFLCNLDVLALRQALVCNLYVPNWISLNGACNMYILGGVWDHPIGRAFRVQGQHVLQMYFERAATSGKERRGRQEDGRRVRGGMLRVAGGTEAGEVEERPWKRGGRQGFCDRPGAGRVGGYERPEFPGEAAGDVRSLFPSFPVLVTVWRVYFQRHLAQIISG